MLKVLLSLCLLGLVRSLSDDADIRAFETASGLYITLRDVVFPQHKLNTDRVENRFLLLMPGKVLNYFDYYPGRDYVNFLQNPDALNKESVVPPHVMEKWFDLADVMPSPNILNAQDTGKSLANVYASILHEIKVLRLDEKNNNKLADVNAAITYLNEMILDPENVTLKVPRLSLYERYRDLYNDRKLEMEDEIEEKRMSIGSLDYELWFQRHYPSLQSKVESAYTRWLIFGDKEKVEMKITILDTGSSGQMLEEARTSLRAAAVQSLDRTRKIYPVSFEPSDWYKYLLPEMQKPSQDQLRLMYGKVLSKSNAIDVMIEAIRNGTDIGSVVEGLQGNYIKLQGMAKANISNYINLQYKCLGHTSESDCSKYDELRGPVIEAIYDESQAFFLYQHANYYNQSKDFINYLQKEKAALDVQGQKIHALLSDTGPYLGGILDSSQLTVANITDAHKDDQWMQFEFDYDSYQMNKNDEETSESIVAHMSFHVLFFSGGGDYSYNKNTEDHNQKFSKSSMRVKGEFLRVNIKRPWFKPEIFENPELTYRESGVDSAASYVSPGRELTETQFYDEVTSDQTHYKLPEYTTGFLLARNIELEFKKLDSETVSSFMSEMSHTGGSGGFLFFHAGASVTKTKQTSHVQVQKTASGMKIKIPGAQVIGYYTETLPRFPIEQ